MKIGKYIFGDNNTNNISENCNNKNINIGAGITITIIVLLIFTVLFCFGIIDFPQFVQLIK